MCESCTKNCDKNTRVIDFAKFVINNRENNSIFYDILNRLLIFQSNNSSFFMIKYLTSS